MKKINGIAIFLIVKEFVQDEFQFYSNFHPTAESESKYWQYNFNKDQVFPQQSLQSN